MKMIIAVVLCGLLMGAEEFVPKVAKDVYLDPKEAGTGLAWAFERLSLGQRMAMTVSFQDSSQ